MKKRGILCVAAALCALLLVPALTVRGAVLSQGSRGEQVKALQTKLSNLGYFPDKIDGIFGARTAAAVKSFQRKNGLAADGIAGSETMKKLGMPPVSGGASSSNRDNDLALLARMISAEGRGEPYSGQVAIGAVIMNRIKHPSFPNSLSGVLFQPGAFSAVNDGQFNQPVSDASRKAAVEAYNGYDPTGGCIYYYNPAKTSNKYMLSLPVVVTIGRHVFCK